MRSKPGGRFAPIHYLHWAKTQPPCRINLARSGIDPCPPELLGLTHRDLVTHLPAPYGYPPLLSALADRYRVDLSRVVSVSGGTSLANWLACATLLDDARSRDEVIVEQPTYEPLLAVVRSFSCRVRRLRRRFQDRYAIDLDRLDRLISSRTRLAVITNLHNPSGVRVPFKTLRAMAHMLGRVGAFLLVDEVYLECLFDNHTDSCVHAGRNVVTTNSLTKAYGLDGLRSGWMLGPPTVCRRAWSVLNHVVPSGVAPGERMALAALRHLPAIRLRAQRRMQSNLETLRHFMTRERRLAWVEPDGGNVCFPRLPAPLDGQRFADHLRERHATLVVPGRFFDSPRHLRISFGGDPNRFRRGLGYLARSLDELSASRPMIESAS